MKIFEEATIGSVVLPNRIIRSATFEGMCDQNGNPLTEYYRSYERLSENQIGGIITGFTFISLEGKAMQPGQAGFYLKDQIPFFLKLTKIVHQNSSKIFLQLAHTGRQTKKRITGYPAFGVSGKRSIYFQEKPVVMTKHDISTVIHQFVNSAVYAQAAGFDGIQLHAAHGYLIHQFILPSINNRKDEYGINKKTKIGTLFLSEIIDNIRLKCTNRFPILVKISAGDDLNNRFSQDQFIRLIQFLDDKKVDAIEISYGTMDYALSIFRGDIPVEVILNHNPIYSTDHPIFKKVWKFFLYPYLAKKIKKFSPMYNLEFVKIAKKYTQIPLICVGGIRNAEEIEKIILSDQIDFVALCRPFIIEPDYVKKIKKDIHYHSKCVNCNICAIMCDTIEFTHCYKNNKEV